MDDVYRKRQLAEGGPDPFQDADLPESDPARSASGAGDGDADAVEAAREMRRRKHEEYLRLAAARAPARGVED